MGLTAGTRLGVYEIVSPIGAGGMGEVYRARDTKLDRDVAIKVLPASFAEDADRVARFTREAKTLASLNHPNIAQIYGLEGHALVMELVDGEDLSALIARGSGTGGGPPSLGEAELRRATPKLRGGEAPFALSKADRLADSGVHRWD